MSSCRAPSRTRPTHGLRRAERTRGILESAGCHEVVLEAFDAPMNVGGGLADLDATVAFMNRIGPAPRLLQAAAPEVRVAAMASIREALLPYHGPTGVVMPASVWLVAAVNG